MQAKNNSIRGLLSVFILMLSFLPVFQGEIDAFSIPRGTEGLQMGKNAEQVFRQSLHDGTMIGFDTPSVQCGVCHQSQFNEWRYRQGTDLDSLGEGSCHALASREDMYIQMLGVMDPSFHVFCKGCHESGSVQAGEDKINSIPEPRTENTSEGINCVVCHYDGTALTGIAELRDPLFCATCHNEQNSFSDTYLEWLYDYGAKKTCQQRHMKSGSHAVTGLHSFSTGQEAIEISDPVLPDTIQADVPFEVVFAIRNAKAGHSVQVDLLRVLRLRVATVNSLDDEVALFEKSFYKRFDMFGENPEETEVIRAGEEKVFRVEQNNHIERGGE